MDKKKQARLVVLFVAALIVVDQVVKILVKTNMQIGEDIPLIGEWCRLHFIENEGFAFGMSMGGATGKVVLTPHVAGWTVESKYKLAAVLADKIIDVLK